MAHPGKAFLLGWGSTTVAAFAAGVALDLGDRPSGSDGLQGIGAVATFLFVMAGILIFGPIIGVACAVMAWRRRRRRRHPATVVTPTSE